MVQATGCDRSSAIAWIAAALLALTAGGRYGRTRWGRQAEIAMRGWLLIETLLVLLPANAIGCFIILGPS